MSRLPDLVRDSKLETTFHPKYTSHIYHEADPASRQRTIPRKEYWRREKRIGRGGFGSVWLERCVKGQGQVEVRAVKQFPKPAKAKEYIRELEAIAKFSHPRYVRCFVKSFGWYDDDSELYIAMEYFPLGDLDSYLQTSQQLPEADVQQVTFQVLEGLLFMHENGYSHRDLKPQNILIHSKPPEEWWVKIADFGISKRVEDATVGYSTIKGTPAFMAPECHEVTPDELSPAADMWALGEIIHRALTSQATFKNLRILFQFTEGQKPFPDTDLRQHNASEAAIQFVQKSMMPTPDMRLTSQEALQHVWMARFAPASPRPPSLNSIGSNENEKATDEDPWDEPWDEPEASARWSTLQLTSSEPIDSTVRTSLATQKQVSGNIPYFTGNIVNDDLTDNFDTLHILSRKHGGPSFANTPPDPDITVQKAQKLDHGPAHSWAVETHTISPIVLAISPDAILIATAVDKPRSINIWNTTSGSIHRALHPEGVDGLKRKHLPPRVVFSPLGDIIAAKTRGSKSRIRVYNVASGIPMRTFVESDDHEDLVPQLEFSADGQLLASSVKGCVKIRELKQEEGTLPKLIHVAETVNSIRLNKKKIAIATVAGLVEIWDLRTLGLFKEVKLFSHSFDRQLCQPLWSPQMETLFFSTSALYNRGIPIWSLANVQSGAILTTCKLEPSIRESILGGNPLNKAFSYDGKFFAVKSGDGKSVEVAESVDGLYCTKHFVGFTVRAISFLESGALVVVGFDDGESKIQIMAFSDPTVEEKSKLKEESGERVRDISSQHSPSYLDVPISRELRNARTNQYQEPHYPVLWSEDSDDLCTFAFSPDGKRLARVFSKRGFISIYNFTEERYETSYNANLDEICSVKMAFSQRYKMFGFQVTHRRSASSGILFGIHTEIWDQHGRIHVRYDTTSYSPIGYNTSKPRLEAGIAFSPNGRYVVIKNASILRIGEIKNRRVTFYGEFRGPRDDKFPFALNDELVAFVRCAPTDRRYGLGVGMRGLSEPHTIIDNIWNIPWSQSHTVSPDVQLLAYTVLGAPRGDNNDIQDYTLVIQDIHQNSRCWNIRLHQGSKSAPPPRLELCFSYDSSFIASYMPHNSCLIVWDVSMSKQLCCFQFELESRLEPVTFLKDGRLLVGEMKMDEVNRGRKKYIVKELGVFKKD